jgi:hypothetical protein
VGIRSSVARPNAEINCGLALHHPLSEDDGQAGSWISLLGGIEESEGGRVRDRGVSATPVR